MIVELTCESQLSEYIMYRQLQTLHVVVTIHKSRLRSVIK
jgi:hypothetical protein